MNPAYLMLGLGFSIPEVVAIREGLPAYRVLRQLIAFFVDNGFSLLPVSEPKPLLAFETLHLGMKTNANNHVVLQYRPEGTYLTCTFQMKIPGGLVTRTYSLGERNALRASLRTDSMSFFVRQTLPSVELDLPYDLALKTYTNRISREYFTSK